MQDGLVSNCYRITPRKPKNIHTFIHDAMDEWFDYTFKIKARSSTILCSTDIDQAKSYAINGGLVEVIPTEPYKIIYSPNIVDLLCCHIELQSMNIDDINSWLSSMNYQLVTNTSALPSDFKGEVMVDCSDYNVLVI